MTTSYITYEYWTPDGKVFYVGAGKKKRAHQHLEQAIAIYSGKSIVPQKCNKHKIYTILGLLKNGTLPIIKIVYEGERDDAFALEVQLIKKYGRADMGTGTLTNLNDGGYSGNWGMKMSIETKKRLSQMRQGEKNSFYGRHHTIENKKKQSEHRKSIYKGNGNPFYGKHHSEETKSKHSAKLKAKFQSGELIPHKHTDSHKNKLSQKYHGENNPYAKEFIVTDPSGIETQIKCLLNWCRNNGFSRDTFMSMLRKNNSPNRGNAKGWRIRRL